jgi:exodeoxyribonuclease VII large subunit
MGSKDMPPPKNLHMLQFLNEFAYDQSFERGLMEGVVLSVSDFVAVLNQTLEYAYPQVTIHGELANLRVSKKRWVYFDLKDETASVKFFGTVYQLPGPLEDGMTLEVRGLPRLHPQYGFSVTVQSIRPVGEGTIRRAAALLEAKLRAEGLFDAERKRQLPYPPERVGLITSSESAAYQDFIKILGERWSGVELQLADVQVQGEPAVIQIVRAIDYFNQQANPPEVLALTRGGGSPEDMAAFSSEQVTRAVAASRIPTLVAIGHESDFSLAELAADQRASTPSNAAQMLVPDKRHEILKLTDIGRALFTAWSYNRDLNKKKYMDTSNVLSEAIELQLQRAVDRLETDEQMLTALSPKAALSRGYAIIRAKGKAIKSASQLKKGSKVSLQLYDGESAAIIEA